MCPVDCQHLVKGSRKKSDNSGYAGREGTARTGILKSTNLWLLGRGESWGRVMIKGGSIALGVESAWIGVLWERRLLAALWLVWACWVCLLSMNAFDVVVSQAARALPEDIHVVFGIITVAGLGKWYLLGFGLCSAGLAVAARAASDQDRSRVYRQWSLILLFVFLAVLVSGLVVEVIKVSVGRARPKVLELVGFYGFLSGNFRADYHSFPSGHAATAASVAMALAYLRPDLRWLAFGCALPVILSRVIINAHFLADIMGGSAIAIFTTWMLREWFASRTLVFSFGTDGLIHRIFPTRSR